MKKNKKVNMTYRNLKSEKQSDGSHLVSVEVLTPKPFKLLLADADESKALREIVKYLESQNATEEIETETTLDI